MDIAKLKADFATGRKLVEKGNVGRPGWTFDIQLYHRRRFNWRWELGKLLCRYLELAPINPDNLSYQHVYGLLRRRGFEWNGEFWVRQVEAAE